MNFKHIMTICKGGKNLVLMDRYDGSGNVVEQFVGNGYAMYPISGLPELNLDILFAMMDVTKNEQNLWVTSRGDITENPVFDIGDPDEIYLSAPPMKFVEHATVMQPLFWDGGMVFVNQKYIPKGGASYDFFLRETEESSYVVIKQGMLLEGVVSPLLPGKTIVDFLELCHNFLRREGAKAK